MKNIKKYDFPIFVREIRGWVRWRYCNFRFGRHLNFEVLGVGTCCKKVTRWSIGQYKWVRCLSMWASTYQLNTYCIWLK